MQTFLPYDSFSRSASVLDRRRLGKQRVETLQILRTLAGETSGWANHPAVKMWEGFEPALMRYGLQICLEWSERGYRDTCFDKIAKFVRYFPWRGSSSPLGFPPNPPWLGDKDFHRSHQSNLIRKNPTHYGPLFLGVPDDLPYIWPK
jgi:hypothetical protein